MSCVSNISGHLTMNHGTGKTLVNLFCGGENASFKIFFLVLSLLFIGQELYTFFILKPTLNTKVKTHFTKDDFPIFTICPNPAFDMEEMNNLGYPDIYSYKTGLDTGPDHNSSTIKGWDANQADSVENVSRKISLIKTVKDCPDLGLAFYKPHEDDHEDTGLWIVLLFITILGYLSKSGKGKEEIPNSSSVKGVLVHVNEDNIGVYSSRPKGIFPKTS